MNFFKKSTKLISLVDLSVAVLTLTFIQLEFMVADPKLFWIRIIQELIFLIVLCSESRSLEDSVFIGFGLVSFSTIIMILVSIPQLRINLLGI